MRSPEVPSVIEGVPLGLLSFQIPAFQLLRSSDQNRNCRFDPTDTCLSVEHTTKATETNMTRLGELELKDAALEAAGNWADFHCFAWFRRNEIKDPENWAIIYTRHRDSGLLDQSNASVIEAELKPFGEGENPDVVFESHHHYLVGHIDGFSIRVFKRGRITKAFKTYHELAERLADYPILDESDYSEREYEAAFENLDHAAWRLKREFSLPEDWQPNVFDWLWQNHEAALENVDDQGGWASEDDLTTAFEALGYQRAA
jgi:hypothetical protein